MQSPRDFPLHVPALGEADRRIRTKLDAFRASATALYHTASGDAGVTLPLRIGDRPISLDSERAVRDAAARLGMTQADATRVIYGRGTPDQIRRIAQVVLARLPAVPPGDPGDSLTDRIRRVMDQHGLGIDCAGYVGQAFLASRGIARADSPLRGVSAIDDDLSRLDERGFVRVAIADARPGDIIALAPRSPDEPGHRIMVVAAHSATAEERAFIVQQAKSSLERASAAHDTERISQASSAVRWAKAFDFEPNLYALTVDSSWAGDGDPRFGGVERRLWVYAPELRRWMWPDRWGTPAVTPSPYDHPLDGVYRPKDEP